MNEDCPDWPLVVTVPENMDAIHSMMWANRRISAKKKRRNSGDISGMCNVYHPYVGYKEPLCQVGAKMFV